MSYIEFRNVTKTYHVGEVDIRALDGVNFSVEKGEFVVIAGASGAGKSTILNILGGMDQCTDGEIEVDGVRIDEMDEKELTDYRRFDIGFVFQFYNLV
ncbi:MAG: ATP-binding cassette domain-containing protein, partial [Solobacterium sp.]|nr:ATP-binding cassette domain-containing protein [Solobacterium sp.]